MDSKKVAKDLVGQMYAILGKSLLLKHSVKNLLHCIKHILLDT